MRSGCGERRARAILCRLTRVEGVSIALEGFSDGPVNFCQTEYRMLMV